MMLVLVLVPVIRASRRCVPVLLVDVTMYLCSYQCYKYLDPWLCKKKLLIRQGEPGADTPITLLGRAPLLIAIILLG